MDKPKLLYFTQPSFHFPNVRSVTSEAGDTLDNNVDTSAESNDAEKHSMITPGSFLAIAGDNTDGYYIVKVSSEVRIL